MFPPTTVCGVIPARAYCAISAIASGVRSATLGLLRRFLGKHRSLFRIFAGQFAIIGNEEETAPYREFRLLDLALVLGLDFNHRSTHAHLRRLDEQFDGEFALPAGL